MTKGFNTSFYRRAKNSEPKKHIEAKRRFGMLMVQEGWTVQYEVAMPRDIPDLGKRSYVVDMLLSRKQGKETKQVIVEVDGLSHGKKVRMLKDKLRDMVFKAEGIPTVRYDLEELVGQYASTDRQIVNKFYKAIIE